MSVVLELKNVNLFIRKQQVLEDINLVLEDKAFLGIIGPNGAGKTMLIKIILGLLRPTSGSVAVFGLPPAKVRGLIGYVPQFASFDADFPVSVLDVVLMGRLRKGRFRPGRRDLQLARESLEKVAMSDFADRQIGGLSGGEMQRVLIARALAVEPRLILLDEPTASLDTRIGRDIYSVLDELKERVSIILVSHDLGVISTHVKTIACMNRCLYYHHSREIPDEIVSQVYGCPIDLIAHGHAHRVFPHHGKEGGK